MLTLNNVTYRFADGAPAAVASVSLALAPAERVCVVGHNGSGKSTLARLACGDLTPSEGNVLLGGEELTEAGGNGAIAYVGQDARQQATSILVEEEVAFSARCQLLEAAEVRERVKASLETCGIAHLRGKDLSELSGGQMQLVAIAAALAAHPRYLLLDEACAHLDAASRERVARVIGSLLQSGIGILQITHDAREMQGASRVVELAHGQIAWQGSPEAWVAREAARARQRTAAMAQTVDALDFLVQERPKELRLENGTASYGKAPVFQNLSLSVRPGELVMMCGPSGVGKSTLARVLSGLHKLDHGQALLGGKPVQPGRVGLAFQRPEEQLYAATVWDDVAYGPRNLGVAEDEVARRVEQALSALGVPESHWHVSAQTLSGGMRRRVALASIISLAPGAFVLDEPTAGLDADGRLLLHQVVARLREAGCAVLLVTHDPQEWEAEATRAVKLETHAAGGKDVEDSSAAAALVQGTTASARRSLLGTIDARVRMFSALLLSVALFACHSFIELAAVAAAIALTLVCGATRARDVRAALVPALPLATAVLLSNALRLDGTGDTLLVGTLGISMSGAYAGGISALRIICLVALAVAFTSDFSSTDVAKVVSMALAPLEGLGVAVSDASLALSVTLALIPQSYAEFRRIEAAQRARGAKFDHGPLVERLRAWAAVMVPLVVVLFERADALARAMRLRGYRGKMTMERTSLAPRDVLVLLAAGALCVAVMAI